MLRVAIVGCGKIADEHAQQISRIHDCKLVGLCDAELLMAKQMHERFNRIAYTDKLDELLAGVRPDAVHVTTPPQTHYAIARRCLEAGCHIYVEKPFTLNVREAVTLIQMATERNLKVTVGHNLQFTEPAIRMRDLVRSGFLGEAPVHLESYYGYNLGDAAYARAFLGDRQHWVRGLPGGLFQNIISHGIGRIAEYMRSDSPTVVAHSFASAFLKGLGEQGIHDELRVIISDEMTTAYFTFSSQMRPILSQLRAYGTRNGLVLDDMHHTLIRLNGAKCKSYLENLIPPVSLGAQYLSNAASNARKFLTGRLNMTAGMRTLIEGFYRSITHNEPMPIPYREIVLSSRIMDAIFSQTTEMSPAGSVARVAQSAG